MQLVDCVPGFSFTSIPDWVTNLQRKQIRQGTANLTLWDRGGEQPWDIASVSVNKNVRRGDHDLLKMR